MKEIVQEYFLLVAQLEHQARTVPGFSLQKLSFYISNSMETFAALDGLIFSLSTPKKMEGKALTHEAGGSLLSVICERMIMLGGYIFIELAIHRRESCIYHF